MGISIRKISAVCFFSFSARALTCSFAHVRPALCAELHSQALRVSLAGFSKLWQMLSDGPKEMVDTVSFYSGCIMVNRDMKQIHDMQ